MLESSEPIIWNGAVIQCRARSQGRYGSSRRLRAMTRATDHSPLPQLLYALCLSVCLSSSSRCYWSFSSSILSLFRRTLGCWLTNTTKHSSTLSLKLFVCSLWNTRPYHVVWSGGGGCIIVVHPASLLKRCFSSSPCGEANPFRARHYVTSKLYDFHVHCLCIAIQCRSIQNYTVLIKNQNFVIYVT